MSETGRVFSPCECREGCDHDAAPGRGLCNDCLRAGHEARPYDPPTSGRVQAVGMGLPDHLEYDEVSDDGPDGIVWFPLVRCTINGCTWTREADWSELGDDSFGADWSAEHPAHA